MMSFFVIVADTGLCWQGEAWGEKLADAHRFPALSAADAVCEQWRAKGVRCSPLHLVVGQVAGSRKSTS